MGILDNLKIAIFTNINDKPTLPSNSKAGNGSHIIAQFNSLIDQLNTPWKIIISNYTALGGEKLVICPQESSDPITITLPEDPLPRTSVSFVKNGHGGVFYIDLNGNSYARSVPEEIRVEEGFQLVTLIFLGVSPTGNDDGWISTREDIVIAISQPT